MYERGRDAAFSPGYKTAEGCFSVHVHPVNCSDTHMHAQDCVYLKAEVTLPMYPCNLKEKWT